MKMMIKGESGKEMQFRSLKEYPNFYYGVVYRPHSTEFMYHTTVPKFVSSDFKKQQQEQKEKEEKQLNYNI